MTDRELMQQALDALEEINKLSIGENAICLPAEIDGALDALRDRLAQPEPVIDKSAAIRIATALGWEPRREWVGLTDEEMHECWDSPLTPLGMKHVRMIEAKLKEKNT